MWRVDEILASTIELRVDDRKPIGRIDGATGRIAGANLYSLHIL
jgi:hypothetical protein